MLTITLKKGLAGKKGTQTRVAAALGLSKYGSSVTRADSPTIRGMINKVHHLVSVTTDDLVTAKKSSSKETVASKAKTAPKEKKSETK